MGEARNRETPPYQLSSASLSFVPLTLTGIGDEQHSTGVRKIHSSIRRLRIEVAQSVRLFLKAMISTHRRLFAYCGRVIICSLSIDPRNSEVSCRLWMGSPMDSNRMSKTLQVHSALEASDENKSKTRTFYGIPPVPRAVAIVVPLS